LNGTYLLDDAPAPVMSRRSLPADEGFTNSRIIEPHEIADMLMHCRSRI
jgi:hypothetical protein